MNRTLRSLVLAFLSSLAPRPAHAAVVFTSERVIIGDYAVYTLSFTATEPGGVIAVFGGNFPGSNAFKGLLSQQWVAGLTPTPTSDLNAAIDESIDTQFLVSSAEIFSARAPFETSTTLGGAFGLNFAARAAVKPLVQIVVPVNVNVCYDFSVAEAVGATGNITRFQGMFLLDGTPCLPEPGTGCAVISAIVASALRRRPIEAM
jgi:hypothetical protein